MKNVVILFSLFIALVVNINAQNFVDDYEYSSSSKKDKPQSIKYNAFGVSDPMDQIMIGGNHVAFRKMGFGLSWRVGAKFIKESNEKSGDVIYENAKSNNWLTGNKSLSYAYTVMPGITFAVTKKIPLFLGAGVIRQRQIEEYEGISGKGWSLNPNETKFNFNFTAQTFIPLGNTVVLNFGYDHLPQSIFIGIAISHKYNFIDIDEW
ncbi:MAG: hypothetical protein NTU43_05315 [Bacteroidetes bacterium]|nr:hypothetical protein [Bacteroidota bacterium]